MCNTQVERRVAYVPNTMLAFAPCHTSFHAVRPIDVEIRRDSIQGFVMFKQDVNKEKCPAVEPKSEESAASPTEVVPLDSAE
jgi:hypothetical protein